MGKNKRKTQECLNNIHIRFPMLENECYAKRTRILRTTVGIMSIGKDMQIEGVVRKW